MELDDLKYQLKHKLSTDHAHRSDEDIAALLTKRTGSIVDKLKRSLWIEIIFGIVFVLVFGYIGIFSSYHSLRLYFSIFAVVPAGLVVILIYLLRRTNRLSAAALPIKSNLRSIVTIIEEFVKRDFQFSMMLVPVCFIVSFLVGYNEPKHIPSVDSAAKAYFHSSTKVIIFFILTMIIFGIGIYFFTKWYLKKLYGRYICQLKACIEELKEE